MWGSAALHARPSRCCGFRGPPPHTAVRGQRGRRVPSSGVTSQGPTPQQGPICNPDGHGREQSMGMAAAGPPGQARPICNGGDGGLGRAGQTFPLLNASTLSLGSHSQYSSASFPVPLVKGPPGTDRLGRRHRVREMEKALQPSAPGGAPLWECIRAHCSAAAPLALGCNCCKFRM